MVVRHVVAWKWKSGTSDHQIDAVLHGVEVFATLPGVINVRSGINHSTRSEGYSHFLEVDVDGWDALAAYRAHPVHVATAEQYIWPIAEATVVLDYELDA